MMICILYDYLFSNTYGNKIGQPKYSTEIVISNFTLLENS